MRLQCPICHVAFVHEVLHDYEVQVRREEETRVGGLQVLTCCNGHVFFVRKLDLTVERTSGAAA
jgi:hypothetical protein